MTHIDHHTMERILRKVRFQFPDANPEDVLSVLQTGSVAEGVVSEEYDQELTDCIQNELDEYGIST